jgi:hypothetical protein
MSLRNKLGNNGLSDETETPSLEYYPFSTVFDSLFNIFAGILLFGMPSFQSETADAPFHGREGNT